MDTPVFLLLRRKRALRSNIRETCCSCLCVFVSTSPTRGPPPLKLDACCPFGLAHPQTQVSSPVTMVHHLTCAHEVSARLAPPVSTVVVALSATAWTFAGTPLPSNVHLPLIPLDCVARTAEKSHHQPFVLKSIPKQDEEKEPAQLLKNYTWYIYTAVVGVPSRQ